MAEPTVPPWQTVVAVALSTKSMPYRALRALLQQPSDDVEILLVHPDVAGMASHIEEALGIGSHAMTRVQIHAVVAESSQMDCMQAGVTLARGTYVRVVSDDVAMSSRLFEHERRLLHEAPSSVAALAHEPIDTLVLEPGVPEPAPISVSVVHTSSLPLALAGGRPIPLVNALCRRELLQATFAAWPHDLPISPWTVSMALSLLARRNVWDLCSVSGGLIERESRVDWADAYADAQRGAVLLNRWHHAQILDLDDAEVRSLQLALLRERFARLSDAVGSAVNSRFSNATWKTLSALRAGDDALVDLPHWASATWYPFSVRRPVTSMERPVPFSHEELKTLRQVS